MMRKAKSRKSAPELKTTNTLLGKSSRSVHYGSIGATLFLSHTALSSWIHYYKRAVLAAIAVMAVLRDRDLRS